MAASPSPSSPSISSPTLAAPNSPQPEESPQTLSLPQQLWSLQIPLSITHASLPSTPPYLVTLPRFSYLALLLPRLSTYFSAEQHPCTSFHHEEILLRNLPLGLLYDLYQPTSLPWKLIVSDGPEWDIADTFTNSAKEADFIRNGNAKQIMSLSKDDSTGLWNSVVDGDYLSFARIHSRLLNAPTPLKNVPMRIYIPSSNNSRDSSDGSGQGSFKVVQTLVPPRLQNRTQQTLGGALKYILPTLFPSSRDPILANVILHGGPVPFRAPLEELMREAAYPDGWLCLIVVLL
ncbi:autophagy protein Apg5-domain-containing protein [Cladorrhinum sp. PSN259]|nr:autophagy protein Apg5-domain-containing protein [Cladorrhinum sp. PSN259]